MDGFMYSMAENGGISTLYVSPVPFEGLNEAVEKGPGRPHLGKAQRKMKKTYPMSESIDNDKSLVKRHSIIVLVEHWAIAISGLALILTGLFGLPIARRYFITEISELRWSGDYIFSLYLHYAASVVFVGASLFHVVYHGLMVHRAMLPKGGGGDLKESWAVINSLFGKGEEPPMADIQALEMPAQTDTQPVSQREALDAGHPQAQAPAAADGSSSGESAHETAEDGAESTPNSDRGQ
jgi:hypothetical protein